MSLFQDEDKDEDTTEDTSRLIPKGNICNFLVKDYIDSTNSFGGSAIMYFYSHFKMCNSFGCYEIINIVLVVLERNKTN